MIKGNKMIKHIVIWKLKESALGNTREKNAQIIKSRLEALPPIIPEIVRLEVGFDFSCTENSGDIVLYSEFKTKEDLNNYQNHPEHVALMPFVMEARSERHVVDYEI
jgi:hypothetical protein